MDTTCFCSNELICKRCKRRGHTPLPFAIPYPSSDPACRWDTRTCSSWRSSRSLARFLFLSFFLSLAFSPLSLSPSPFGAHLTSYSLLLVLVSAICPSRFLKKSGLAELPILNEQNVNASSAKESNLKVDLLSIGACGASRVKNLASTAQVTEYDSKCHTERSEICSCNYAKPCPWKLKSLVLTCLSFHLHKATKVMVSEKKSELAEYLCFRFLE